MPPTSIFATTTSAAVISATARASATVSARASTTSTSKSGSFTYIIIAGIIGTFFIIFVLAVIRNVLLLVAVCAALCGVTERDYTRRHAQAVLDLYPEHAAASVLEEAYRPTPYYGGDSDVISPPAPAYQPHLQRGIQYLTAENAGTFNTAPPSYHTTARPARLR